MVPEPPSDTITAAAEVAGTPTLRRRLVWIPVGLLCVGLGGVGIVLPGLPSTIFFLAAAAAFSKSSPRLEAWVLDLRGVGPLIRDYRAGLGMPRRAKVIAITMMWAAIVLSGLATGRAVVALGLALLGVAGTVTILRVRTREA
ncbi:MAG: YbaN family protein [Acidimicrobiales bacterium]|nr:YbaN family protein [Acidimicrobiales bacterium]